MDKPVVPHQCAGGRTDCDPIYPSDARFYKCHDGYFYCSEACLMETHRHTPGEKAENVRQKQKHVAQQRAALGL